MGGYVGMRIVAAICGVLCVLCAIVGCSRRAVKPPGGKPQSQGKQACLFWVTKVRVPVPWSGGGDLSAMSNGILQALDRPSMIRGIMSRRLFLEWADEDARYPAEWRPDHLYDDLVTRPVRVYYFCEYISAEDVPAIGVVTTHIREAANASGLGHIRAGLVLTAKRVDAKPVKLGEDLTIEIGRVDGLPIRSQFVPQKWVYTTSGDEGGVSFLLCHAVESDKDPLSPKVVVRSLPLKMVHDGPVGYCVVVRGYPDRFSWVRTNVFSGVQQDQQSWKDAPVGGKE